MKKSLFMSVAAAAVFMLAGCAEDTLLLDPSRDKTGIRDNNTVSAEEIGIFTDVLPAGVHNAGLVKVVALFVYILPAGDGDAAFLEEVQRVINFPPAGDRLGVKILVKADAFLLNPAAAVHVFVVPQPAAQRKKPRQSEDQQDHCGPGPPLRRMHRDISSLRELNIIVAYGRGKSKAGGFSDKNLKNLTAHRED